MILEAFKTFVQSPFADDLGIDIVFNPDEETGSLASAGLLARMAKGAGIGMIYEPALADGTLAGARKGSGNFTLKIEGLSAHAGRNPKDGRNAIIAAAKAALWLEAIGVGRDDLSVNIARIDGGSALNVVPDSALVRFNIRIEVCHGTGLCRGRNGQGVRSPKCP